MIDSGSGYERRPRMGRASRNKGKVGQRELVALLRECGWDGAHTEAGAQSVGAKVPDVDAPGLPLWIECKYAKAFKLKEALRQAETDTTEDRQPVVMFRLSDRSGPRDDPFKKWMCLVDAEYLLLLERLKAMHWGKGEKADG